MVDWPGWHGAEHATNVAVLAALTGGRVVLGVGGSLLLLYVPGHVAIATGRLPVLSICLHAHNRVNC